MLAHPASQQILETYRRRTPRSERWHVAAGRVLPGGDTRTVTFFAPHPLSIDRAQGSVLTDVDGNDYLDLLGNYTSMVHGHAHPEIVRAITAQASRGTGHAANSPLQVRLAEELCRRVLSVERIRFCNSGTEATLNAIRAARAFTGRDKLLKMEGGYHGSHDLAEISVAPDLALAGPPERPVAVAEEPGIPQAVVDDVIVAPFNDPIAAEAACERHAGEVAAILVEPMLGASGAIPAEPGFLEALRALADDHGALLIFDEVITFRLHEGGYQTWASVRPDLTTFGKVIGGGLPVGAFGGRADVMALFAPPQPRMVQSGTFNANPLTMAAGLAAVRALDQAAIDSIDRLAERLASGLRDAAADGGIALQVTGVGSILTTHWTTTRVRDYRSGATSRDDVQALMHLALLNEGVFTAPRGLWATNTAMTEADVDHAVAAFAAALTAVRPFIAANAPELLLTPGGDPPPPRPQGTRAPVDASSR